MSENQASSGDVTALKLPELKAAASALGLKGVAQMRKQDLVDAIRSAQGSASHETGKTADTDKTADTGKTVADEVGARLDQLSHEGHQRRRVRSGPAEPPLAVVTAVERAVGDEEGGRARRRRRNRDRDRDRDRNNRRQRTGNDIEAQAEAGVREDDVLVEVGGILDILDNYAFVRTSGYLPGPNDAYVSLSVVRKAELRKGDVITGAVRMPRDGERTQKYNPLVRLDTVNGVEPERMKGRVDFFKLTPLYPQERLRLETTPTNMTGRIIDLIAPIGKGQRGLIVSPPKAGKTMIMQNIANAIAANNPEVYLMVVLVEERPEE
ncbi:MAG: Rho termination factor N-terminal domain-containing protein, partial [Propionibacteriaceae bacterium]|nr:Rho termination factor N-terminal domain-containing protein [Propionibacteriaceae bacterium]